MVYNFHAGGKEGGAGVHGTKESDAAFKQIGTVIL